MTAGEACYCVELVITGADGRTDGPRNVCDVCAVKADGRLFSLYRPKPPVFVPESYRRRRRGVRNQYLKGDDTPELQERGKEKNNADSRFFVQKHVSAWVEDCSREGETVGSVECETYMC